MDVDKICIEVQKTSDNAGGKLTRGFSLQHTTFSALELQLRNRFKELRSSWKGYTHEKSNCPVSNIFMPFSALSTMSLPSVQTVIEFQK